MFFLLKWILLDPQGQGPQFGKWLLKRFLIVVALNIQIFYWSNWVFCDNIITEGIKESSNSTSKFSKYLLIGVSGVFLGYCIYKACTGFVTDVYYPYVTRIITVRNRMRSLSSGSLKEDPTLLLLPEVRSNSHLIIKMRGEHVKSPLEMLHFQREMERDGYVLGNQVNGIFNELVAKNSQINRFNDDALLELMATPEYQHKSLILQNPNIGISKRFEMLVFEYVNASEIIHSNFPKLSSTDLKILANFYRVVDKDTSTIVDYIVDSKELHVENVIGACLRMERLQAILELLKSNNTTLMVYGLKHAGLEANYFGKNVLAEDVDYASIHAGAETLGNIIPQYKYYPSILKPKLDTEVAFDFNNLVVPVLLDAGILGSYGFLGICSFFFGTYNPISKERAGIALANLGRYLCGIR